MFYLVKKWALDLLQSKGFKMTLNHVLNIFGEKVDGPFAVEETVTKLKQIAFNRMSLFAT